MATIKPIEGRSVHQIQSGQVIVDLCSVVKELVENSLDAGATSIEVRFRGNGLDAIEVQDNGNGVAPDDYETIALKHYTSKLSSYDDLSSLQTFGFRGEALSSLCALSTFYITTARAQEAPRGTKLEFEQSGKLLSTSVIASQKGTTVVVEGIFKKLPVRRKELERNLKREYGKALGLLQAYACISTNVRFSVSNQAAKGGKTVAFSTKANLTTKENISNVYGAKTITALVKLDLELDMQPTLGLGRPAVMASGNQPEKAVRTVKIEGYISRPVIGEGRQAPDRQMFFVNSRPCALPQVSKALNEVYRSFNVTQSPFIFANLLLDTNAYDVNVSPDKRTILLHDQTTLLESMKTALTDLFDKHDQTVPSATMQNKPKQSSKTVDADQARVSESGQALAQSVLASDAMAHPEPEMSTSSSETSQNSTRAGLAAESVSAFEPLDEVDTTSEPLLRMPHTSPRLLESQKSGSQEVIDNLPDSGQSAQEELPIPSSQNGSQKYAPGPIQNAFARMRPKRLPEETVTLVVGNRTTQVILGSAAKKRKTYDPLFGAKQNRQSGSQLFGKSLLAFAAPGTQADADYGASDNSDEEGHQSPVGNSASEDPADSEQSPFGKVHGAESDGHSPAADVDLPFFVQDDDGSDEEYVDDAEKRRREEARVARMIAEAEAAAARPFESNVKRAANALRARKGKDSTLQLIHNLDSSVARIDAGLRKLKASLDKVATTASSNAAQTSLDSAVKTAEERLSLTVSKSDFNNMRIIGQFNLGFILALRPSTEQTSHRSSELFIVDQHAADEKYNFERLSANTTVQNQRLVHPKPLELTAVEEEIILEHPDVLAQNGFSIETDQSGVAPVGRRCRLVGLPMSKEVTFTVRDLEVLVALLGESSTDTTMAAESVVRPSRVRKMLAMRACRSSIMVGRSLTGTQMSRVVRHMGEMDKPWNCPHGRPTMRHLFRMDTWPGGWLEGQGLVGIGEEESVTDWKGYLQAAET